MGMYVFLSVSIHMHVRPTAHTHARMLAHNMCLAMAQQRYRTPVCVHVGGSGDRGHWRRLVLLLRGALRFPGPEAHGFSCTYRDTRLHPAALP